MNRRDASHTATARRTPALLGAAAFTVAGLGVILSGCPHTGPDECFRSVACVEMCGGPVLLNGCFGCPAGMFDNITCTDGGGDCGECFRAIDCVETCGGPVLQSGCCPCPSGSFDSISCADGGCGECKRAIDCVETCGGPVLQSGCCPCPTGSFDNVTCGDGGADAGDGG